MAHLRRELPLSGNKARCSVAHKTAMGLPEVRYSGGRNAAVRRLPLGEILQRGVSES
jgi:hypothetical protein